MTSPAALDSPRALWGMMTVADRTVCVGFLALSVAVALGSRAWSGSAADAFALVTIAGEEQASLPLARDEIVTFAGRLGPVAVETKGRAVAVTQSTCPHRVCVGMGWKRRPGEVIACVPNELLVRVSGGEASPDVPDAVTR